jgi:hypothetical protein
VGAVGAGGTLSREELEKALAIELPTYDGGFDIRWAGTVREPLKSR